MQIALDPATGQLVGDDAPAQVRQCLRNIEAVVTAAGAGLRRRRQGDGVPHRPRDVRGGQRGVRDVFRRAPPARAVVGASALPRGALVAVEAIATVG